MKILLTGANGYIGKRLLPVLLSMGHEVVCCVRDRKRLPAAPFLQHPSVSILELDLLNVPPSVPNLDDVDAAYYLVHSMSDRLQDFEELEVTSANNFIRLLMGTRVQQIIYLGGIVNDPRLSRHLSSRKHVDEILRSSGIPVTTLKAGIIVGSGSSSFEIIRDLVERLPVMITPRWLNTKIQPIGIKNVLEYLTGVLLKADTFDQSYDIGGAEVLTYKDLLLQFAETRGLKRLILTLPVMTPRLSSYWLYFVTSTSYKLAVNLVNSMYVEVIARSNNLGQQLGIRPDTYRQAVANAFKQTEENEVISSWKDSMVSSMPSFKLYDHLAVPVNGCLMNKQQVEITGSGEQVLSNFWSIGGSRGWYYGDWLWLLRGFLDKVVGGVGLRRGRTNQSEISSGDTLDFWRVLVADKEAKRLLLFAEMKLPGEAWLEFWIREQNGKPYLFQTATFRPKGLFGRLYWYVLVPIHFFLFKGMAQRIVNFR
ncbi:MAG: SDR family oxidoreductase [Bacteroidetes bacterium]|nr:SDR family oxidoreductase [Bacteroidota bacterium]